MINGVTVGSDEALYNRRLGRALADMRDAAGMSARTDRRWAVPVGAMLALPVLRTTGLALLVAVIPLAGTLGRYSPAHYIVERGTS